MIKRLIKTVLFIPAVLLTGVELLMCVLVWLVSGTDAFPDESIIEIFINW